jgi:Kdo2-lipid IVA lauroyltransferase/acyltransferase
MLGYLSFRLLLFIFRWIPFSVIYLMSNGLRPLLQYVFKYRRNVVRSQMRSCFPDWSKEQLAAAETAFYKNLTDVLLEGIKGISVPAAQINARVRYEQAHLISDYLKKGQSVIMTGSHHCNWEWAAITVAAHVEGEVVGVYKRLSNPYIERFVKKQRAAMGMTLLEMKSTLQAIELRSTTAAAYVLMADQWPSNPNRAHWVTFMGRETACLPGVDFICRDHGYPVIYYEMRRTGRGYYTITFSELVSAGQTWPREGSITKINQARIEQQVMADPHNWLWSHKRWKRERVT